MKLNPSSVYRKWGYVFERGYVRRVLLLPSDAVSKRRTVLLSGVNNEHIKTLISSMKDAYFLELIHTAHIYHAAGEFTELQRGGQVVALELIGSSDELMLKQVNLICKFERNEVEIVPLPKGEDDSVILSDSQERFARQFFYSNLYGKRIEEVARSHQISPRTASRWLDRILAMHVMFAYPMLNQAIMEEFRICVISLKHGVDTPRHVVFRRINEMGMVSNRYLLYRFINGTLNMLLYYNSLSELDKCINEMAEEFRDFVVFTRFESKINEQLLQGN